MKRQALGPAIAILATLFALPALADGDAVAGKKVFNKCMACHDATSEKDRLGPHLLGVIAANALGRKRLGRLIAMLRGQKFGNKLLNIHGTPSCKWGIVCPFGAARQRRKTLAATVETIGNRLARSQGNRVTIRNGRGQVDFR